METLGLRHIRTLGDPALRVPSQPVPQEAFGSPELRALVAELTETMRAAHGLGIAAPQVGVQQRVVIIEVDGNPRYPDAPLLPWTCLINPRLSAFSERREEAYEGCLSLPGLRGPVERHAALRIDAFDVAGKPFALALQGAFARVAQHESDHLDGILYIDRIKAAALPRFGFQDALLAAGIDLSINRATPPSCKPLDPAG